MTWLVITDPSGRTLVEHHALVAMSDTVVSRHETLPEAREAGQKDLFC